MKSLLIRLLINAVALYAAATLLNGIHFQGSVFGLLAVAAVFGVVNALIRPVAMLLSLPARVLTLGVFTVVINALMLWLTSVFAEGFGIGFSVTGVIPALVGALIVSVVSAVLSWVLPGTKKHE